MQEARAKLHHDMQHFVNEVTAEELDEIIKHMENCAILAHEAGVDCIEIHGDRLVGSLCSPILNHRTDEYGGDLANRTRFADVYKRQVLSSSVPCILLFFIHWY